MVESLLTGSFHLDCALAAAVAAAGNRLQHWYRAGRITLRMGIYAAGYVLSGGAIGFFFGIYFTNVLVALIVGGVWPVAVEAQEAAQAVVQSVVKSLRAAGSAEDAIGKLSNSEELHPNDPPANP